MHFVKFRAVNAGPFVDLDLELGRGAVVVIGPNGSGKSSLLKFMFAALTNDFGRFDGGVKVDCVRNVAGDKAPSYIHAVIEHDGHVLDIKRNIRSAPATVLIIDGGMEITDSKKAQKEIDAVLGVDGQMISRYVFKEQDCVYDFISMIPSELAKSFAVLCRTQHCEVVWNHISEFLNKDAEVNAIITDNSDEIAQAISVLKTEMEEVSSSIRTEEARMLNKKSFDAAREILRRQQRVEDLIQEGSKQEVRKNSLEETVGEYRSRKKRRDVKVTEANEKVILLRSVAEDARAALKAFEQYSKYRARRRQLKQEAEELAEEAERHRPPADLDSGDLSLDQWKCQMYEWRRQLSDAQNVVEAFSKSGFAACPVCKTPVSNLTTYIDQQKSLASTLPVRISEAEGTIDKIEEYLRESRKYERWKAGHDARLKANQEGREALKDVKAPDGDEGVLRNLVENYDAAVCDLEEVKSALASTTGQLNKAEADLEAARTRLAEIASSIADNKESEDRVTRARCRLAEHDAAEKECARLGGRLLGLQRQVNDKEDELKRLRTRLKRSKRIRRAAKVVEKVRDVMHRDRLPRRVARRNLLCMEGDINDNLSLFGDPFWVETNEDLKFIANKPGEPPQPAARLSTGQRVVLALSFWPAVGSLWAQDLGMLALDEPTANLDEANRGFLREALGILTAKVRGNRQLIMVTHDHNICAAFDQVIDLSNGG